MNAKPILFSIAIQCSLFQSVFTIPVIQCMPPQIWAPLFISHPKSLFKIYKPRAYKRQLLYKWSQELSWPLTASCPTFDLWLSWICCAVGSRWIVGGKASLRLCYSLSNLPLPPPLVLSLNQVSMQVIPLFIFLLNFLLEISRMDGWAGAVNVTRPQWPAVWIWRCATAFCH